MKQRGKKLALRWGLIAAALLALVWLNGFGLGIPCPIYAITGLYCPGCGSMRALSALAHFDVPGAFRFNPAFVLLLPVLAVGFGLDAWRFVKAAPPKPRPWHTWAALALAIALVAFGVLRNLPAFSYLAPAVG